MQLSRLISGHTPLVTNIHVYGTASILDGAFLVTTANTASLIGAIVSVASATNGTSMIGVTQEGSERAALSKENNSLNASAFRIGSDGLPNGTTITGENYLPVLINTDALYMAEYSQTTAAGTASDVFNNWTAAASTTLTTGSGGEDISGTWLFSVPVSSSGTPTTSGQLRHVQTQAAATSWNLATAMTISADNDCIVTAKPQKKGVCPVTLANKIRSSSGGSATAMQLNGSPIMALDNYIVHDQAPMHVLRKHVDDGLNALTGVRMYGELKFTDPFLMNG